MTYVHGESAQYKLHDRLQAARERAAVIELQTLEAHNKAAQSRLDAYLAVRDREAGLYPVDPAWREHVAVLNRELAAYDRDRRNVNSHQTRTKVPATALQGVTGIIAPDHNSGPAQAHTAPPRLWAVS